VEYNPNIVYFRGREEGFTIAIDRTQVITMLAKKEPTGIIGEAPEMHCILFLKDLGEEKPFFVLGEPQQIAAQLGWPPPPIYPGGGIQ